MSERRIIIEEVGKPALPPPPPPPSGLDLQDGLILGGIAAGETAALVIWWPAALILACLFCFGFAWLIELEKKKLKRLTAQKDKTPHGIA